MHNHHQEHTERVIIKCNDISNIMECNNIRYIIPSESLLSSLCAFAASLPIDPPLNPLI